MFIICVIIIFDDKQDEYDPDTYADENTGQKKRNYFYATSINKENNPDAENPKKLVHLTGKFRHSLNSLNCPVPSELDIHGIFITLKL